MRIFDFAIIGGGSAGFAAARTATALGLSTAIIEGGQKVGGLCILRGCMPSKTLIESANRFTTLQRAQEFGLQATNLEAHGERIIARKRSLIDAFANYRQEQLETGNFTFLRGSAVFLDANNLRVTHLDGHQETLAFRFALIATGSTIHTPDLPGLAATGFLTSDAVLDLAALPPSITVLGAGPVALEMAHYLAALGTKVTVIQRNHQFLTGNDFDIAQVVETSFRQRGIQVFTKTKLLRFEKAGILKRTVFEHEGREVFVENHEILNALGRSPNTSNLCLEAAGIETIGRGKIKISSTQQTSQPHIFAAGDVSGPFEIVHIAIQQAEIAAQNAAKLHRDHRALLDTTDYRLKLFVVFTEPQVAVVGLNEEEARAKSIGYRAAQYAFNDHGKSLVMRETEGFVKLLADTETHEILGGACVGPHASELIHEIVTAMAFHATVKQLTMIPHYHPTLSEIWTYPAEELARIGH